MLSLAMGSDNYYPVTDDRCFQKTELTLPTITANDLLVEVLATAVNPIDIATRKTLHDLKQPRVLGFDAVGVIQQVGSAVRDFQPGERVFYAGDLKRPGSNAQLQVVDQRLVALAPQKLSVAQSAAMPLTALTAYELLFEKLHLTLNTLANQAKSILIINGAGGVGSSAIQLAKLCGLQVWATASRSESVAWVKKLGADHVLDHHQDLVQQAQKQQHQYFDYILVLSDVDAHWQEIIQLIQPATGMIGTITNMSQHQINDLKRLSVSFCWEWMFAKSYYQTPNLASQGQYLRQIAAWLDQGLLRSTLTTEVAGFEVASLQHATQLVESQHTTGKVVLTYGKP